MILQFRVQLRISLRNPFDSTFSPVCDQQGFTYRNESVLGLEKLKSQKQVVR